MENHRYLFHGTGRENLLSILSRGLLIAPPEAALCGHAFGKGVYFADQFLKSKNYTGSQTPSYVFICQVGVIVFMYSLCTVYVQFMYSLCAMEDEVFCYCRGFFSVSSPVGGSGQSGRGRQLRARSSGRRLQQPKDFRQFRAESGRRPRLNADSRQSGLAPRRPRQAGTK